MPTHLGWSAPKKVMTVQVLSDSIERIKEKTFGNLTAPNPDARPQTANSTSSSSSSKRSVVEGESVKRMARAPRLRMH